MWRCTMRRTNLGPAQTDCQEGWLALRIVIVQWSLVINLVSHLTPGLYAAGSNPIFLCINAWKPLPASRALLCDRWLASRVI